jgi:hypothetical protein
MGPAMGVDFAAHFQTQKNRPKAVFFEASLGFIFCRRQALCLPRL